jgi:chromosome segregation ATPase
LQATVGLEKSKKKQKHLEDVSNAAKKRCEALEHRNQQQNAALKDAQTKRKAAEESVAEADERCESLAGRLIAAEAAAADARERAARVIHMREAMNEELDAAWKEAAHLRSEVRTMYTNLRCVVAATSPATPNFCIH